MKWLGYLIRSVIFFFLALIVYAYAALYLAGVLADQYREQFQSIYATGEGGKDNPGAWLSRTRAAIARMSADRGYRDLLFAGSYPCLKAELFQVEKEFTELNQSFLDMVERTEKSPGLTLPWASGERSGDLLPPPAAPGPEEGRAATELANAQSELYSGYLQWKGRRDDLRVRIDGLDDRVRLDREALGQSLAGLGQGLVSLGSAAVGLVEDLWSWASRRLQAV